MMRGPTRSPIVASALSAALLAASACGGAPRASPSRSESVLLPKPTTAERASPAFGGAPYEGLYFAPAGGKDACALFLPWLVCLGDDGVVVGVSAEGGRLAPLARGVGGFALVAPSGAAGAFQLRTKSGNTLEERHDPYLARMEQHLAGSAFVRIDSSKYSSERPVEDAYTSDAITMDDAMIARVDLHGTRERGCERAVFFGDPTWNRSIPLRPAPPAPAPGDLGMRMFMVMKLADGCDGKVDLRAPHQVRGVLGGAKLYADPDGAPVGLSLEGYMYAETFVARGAPRAAVERMLNVAESTREEQAE